MRNDFAVKREQRKDGKVFLFVDTKKAVLLGREWTQLGDWGKRKFENMLFLTRMNGGSHDQFKIKYN